MSAINIQHSISCEAGEAKDTVSNLLVLLEEKYAVSHKFEDDYNCSLSGAGVNGSLTIHENEIEITVKLGFLMAPFKTVIESEIRRKLEESFET